MFVLPRARGHGIGERMMDVLLAQARAAGFRRAILSSHHAMRAAHATYRRSGFRDVPLSADFPSAVVGIDVCMELSLNTEPPT